MFVDFNILNQLGSPAINSNTFANRPAAGQTGRLFVSTDTFEIYRDNGTTWDLIGGPGSSTITGTGTATQVAYFTSSQAIGSSANLYWDNTSGFLGVATATPSARIEAVKTDGVGIYANFTTNAGSGSSTTALWAKNITNSSGFAAVIEETTPNTTAGQYPLLIKHSLSSGTAGVGMGTGIHWQLPDDAGTFKTTQLTIETIDAAAATYATRYRFNVQSNGTGTPVAYINATGLGIFTATPGAALDIHSTGTIAQFNTTSATGNTYIAFQRTGSGLWRIGDTYNSGANFFELHNTVLTTDALQVAAATNKTTFQAQQTYTTGLARGNYFDYNLSVSAGGSFSSPNAITALGASLDLTLAGSATIPSGARSGIDAYNSISFTGTGTLTHNQGAQIRAYSNLTAGWAFNGSATGTITHLAGLRALFPDNSGSAVNVTNNYALLLNDQTPNTGTVTYTNRWGIYQEGASDLNYFAATTLIGTTVNAGYKLDISGYLRAYTASSSVSPRLDLGGTIIAEGSTRAGLYILTGGTDASSYGSIWWGNGNTNTDAFITVNNSTRAMAFGTADGERMRLDAGGRLGINSNSPDNLLTVQKDMTTSTAIPDNGVAGLVVRGSTSTLKRIGIGYDTTNNRGVIQAQITGTGPSPLLLNPDGGNIGIGIVPTRVLDVNGVIRTTNSGSAGAPSIELGTSAQGNGIFYPATNTLAFATNDTERVRITSGGLINVLSDSTNSTFTGGGPLAIKNAASEPFLSFHSNTGTRLGYLQMQSTGAGYLALDVNQPLDIYTNATRRVRVTEGGNVLIGTTTDAGQKLQVNGDIKIGYTKTASGNTGSINNATATTMFAITGGLGLWLVACNLPAGNGSPTLYTAFATIVVDGTTNPRIVSNDGTALTITLSSTNVQVTQTSGGTQAGGVDWVYQKIG